MRYRLSAFALMLTTGCLLVVGCGAAQIGGSGSAPAGAVAGAVSAAASASAPIEASSGSATPTTIEPGPADSSTTAAGSASASASTGESRGSDTAEGAIGPLCDLFTTAEVQQILGADVLAPHDAAGGTGCQWDGSGGVDATYLQIQVIDDPSYYVEQSSADGFEKVKGIGTAAFIVPELGGWAAQAVTDKATFAVAVNGGTAGKVSAIALLHQLVDRH